MTQEKPWGSLAASVTDPDSKNRAGGSRGKAPEADLWLHACTLFHTQEKKKFPACITSIIKLRVKK